MFIPPKICFFPLLMTKSPKLSLISLKNGVTVSLHIPPVLQGYTTFREFPMTCTVHQFPPLTHDRGDIGEIRRIGGRNAQSLNMGTWDGRKRENGLRPMKFPEEFLMEGRSFPKNLTGNTDKRRRGWFKSISTRLHTHTVGSLPPGRLQRMGAHQR